MIWWLVRVKDVSKHPLSNIYTTLSARYTTDFDDIIYTKKNVINIYVH